jgi:hypothetical protein
VTSAGTKRSAGRGSFIESVIAAVDDFYEQVLQSLKPWMPAPPKLRSADQPASAEPVATSLIATAISSQDGPEVIRIPHPSGGPDEEDHA